MIREVVYSGGMHFAEMSSVYSDMRVSLTLKWKERVRKEQHESIGLKARLCDNLFVLSTGIHPTIISESFQKALDKSIEVLTNMAKPVELSDRETLLNSATTSLNSKVQRILELCTSRLVEPLTFPSSCYRSLTKNTLHITNLVGFHTLVTFS